MAFRSLGRWETKDCTDWPWQRLVDHRAIVFQLGKNLFCIFTNTVMTMRFLFLSLIKKQSFIQSRKKIVIDIVNIIVYFVWDRRHRRFWGCHCCRYRHRRRYRHRIYRRHHCQICHRYHRTICAIKKRITCVYTNIISKQVELKSLC